MKRTTLYLTTLLLAICPPHTGFAKTANWPTWRGPLATGVVPHGNPPITWSETENLLWKVKLDGDGSNSTPIVWGDRLYYQSAVKTNKAAPQTATTAAQAEDPQNSQRRGRGGFGGKAPTHFYQFNLVCHDRHSGKRLWSKTVAETLPHERHHGDHGYVSFSPVTDGKQIWACFGSQGLHCFDMDGNPKWKAELGAYLIRAQFGEAGSPALAGDLIIVVKDHEAQSFIAAFNKDTGNQVWKKDRDEPSNWTTPLVVEVNGRLQVVVNGTNHVYGYDAQNGEILWKCTGQSANAVPTPVLGTDLVFCTSGHRGNKLQAIKLGQTGDLTGTAAVAWEHSDKTTPYVPSPLCYQDKLYVCLSNQETITCYDAPTGKALYTKQNLPELKGIYASPIGVANRVYFVGRNGVTSVLENTDTLNVLATNKLDDNIDCSPVVIGDTLYLKGKNHLYCIAADSKTVDANRQF